MDTSAIAQNSIHFTDHDLKKVYDVQVKIKEGDSIKTTLDYKVAVTTLEVFESGEFIVSVSFSDFFKINGRNPDLILEQIAWKCRKAFKDLFFKVAKTGEILSLLSFHEVQEKWIETKEKLRMEYSGKEFEDYLFAMDSVIENEQAFLEKIKRDVFINQFFYPIYDEAFSEFKRKTKESVRFFGINYNIDMLLEIKNKGMRNAEKNLILAKALDTETYDNAKMPVVSYKAKYALNEKMEIQHISGEFENHSRKYAFRIKGSGTKF